MDSQRHLYNTSLLKRNEVPGRMRIFESEVERQDGMDPPTDFSWKRSVGRRKGLAYMKKLGAQDFKLYAGLTILTRIAA